MGQTMKKSLPLFTLARTAAPKPTKTSFAVRLRLLRDLTEISMYSKSFPAACSCASSHGAHCEYITPSCLGTLQLLTVQRLLLKEDGPGLYVLKRTDACIVPLVPGVTPGAPGIRSKMTSSRWSHDHRMVFVSPSCGNVEPHDAEIVDELDEGELKFVRVIFRSHYVHAFQHMEHMVAWNRVKPCSSFLPTGTLVRVEEVAYLRHERRVRARIAYPAGWITLFSQQTRRFLGCNRHFRRLPTAEDGSGLGCPH